ncbi:MAG TPA: geranylgeranylglyceryl/heptaprenylglyceryl phosphate synthase [Thermoplasmata archaeon]|nr:geranylgeranylglyceryl/heptaprenylglyceryl phosphate synthase [Thermoplasmata archaeon]HLA47188.1 geranylgeranylglyceryl/heptaprenylglyceryl phosphate synthase [Thermoplasmata archaeon]
MKVFDYILERVARGKVHMTLIDPDKQDPAAARDLSTMACAAGTDGIMVGGSTGVTQEKVDESVLSIKAGSTVPVILFPSGFSGLSRHADALYFMSLLNSRSPRLIVGEQQQAARAIQLWGLEPIPMAYLIVEPGMRAGEVGEANAIPRSNPEEAVRWALTAQYFGMHLVYLEAGSGAPEPVPTEMVRAVKAAIQVPLIVGGGIRSPAVAAEIAKAGADILVTGTFVEKTRDPHALRNLIAAVKSA